MGRKDTMDTKASKAILIKVSYLVNLNEDETDLFDNITGEISNDQKIVINSKLKNIEWVETSSLELTPNEMNCGKCSNCETWTTDREKPNPIMELCIGATVDGRLFCDECLPENHRWAF